MLEPLVDINMWSTKIFGLPLTRFGLGLTTYLTLIQALNVLSMLLTVIGAAVTQRYKSIRS